jgi:drug/metabolite transporter (DMT)-like permease
VATLSEKGRGAGPRTTSLVLSLLIPSIFVVLWSTGFIFAKLGLPYTEPFTFLALRFALVVPLLVILAFILRSRWPRNWKEAGHSAVVGVLFHLIYLGGAFVAISEGVSAGVTALIVGIQPILTATIVGPFLGEKVSRLQWAGLAMGMCGVILVLQSKLTIGEGSLFGYAVGFAALAGITIGTVYQKRFCSDVDLMSGGVIQYAAAGVGAALIATFSEEWRVTLSFDLVIAIAWLAIILSVVTVTLLMVLIRRGEASRVATLFYLVPPVTVLMAWPLFGETLSLIAIIGMVIAVAGVALANR